MKISNSPAGKPITCQSTLSKRTLEIDLDNRKFKSEALGFEWIRNHIYLTSKKRGLRTVTNKKKHSSRFERRKIHQQLKNGTQEEK